MRRNPAFLTLALLAAATPAGLIGCESKQRNARDEVFESDGGRGMNDRLDEYAEAPPEQGSAPNEAAPEQPGSDAPPPAEVPAATEPTKP